MFLCNVEKEVLNSRGTLHNVRPSATTCSGDLFTVAGGQIAVTNDGRLWTPG